MHFLLLFWFRAILPVGLDAYMRGGVVMNTVKEMINRVRCFSSHFGTQCRSGRFRVALALALGVRGCVSLGVRFAKARRYLCFPHGVCSFCVFVVFEFWHWPAFGLSALMVIVDNRLRFPPT